MKRTWTLIIEQDEHNTVTVRTDPDISKADIAHHIAQLKVNSKGLGAGFQYMIAARNYLTTLSKGIGARAQRKDGRLIIPAS